MLKNPKSLIPAAGLILWAVLVEVFGLSGTPEATGLACVVTFLTVYTFTKACRSDSQKAKTDHLR